MNGKFLLDTNMGVAYLNNENIIREHLAGIIAYVPSIVFGELFYGAMKSKQISEDVSNIEHLKQLVTTLNCTYETGLIYGQIRTALSNKGRPIPDNDIWIAATAQQHGLTLVTRDEHFKHIETLSMATW